MQYYFIYRENHLNQHERGAMNDQAEPITCSDDTQLITMHLPCRLAQRAEKYANENGHTITGVVIEALDAFLRGQNVDG